MNQTTSLDRVPTINAPITACVLIMNCFSMKEKIKYVKQVVLSEGVGTKEGGTTRSLTAAEGR